MRTKLEMENCPSLINMVLCRQKKYKNQQIRFYLENKTITLLNLNQ